MAERVEHGSVARAMDVLGERWALLILRGSVHGVRRLPERTATSGSRATSFRRAGFERHGRRLAGGDEPPAVLRHRRGHDAGPEIVFRHGHEPLRARDVTLEGRDGPRRRDHISTTTEAA